MECESTSAAISAPATQYNMQVGLGMPHPVNLNDQMEVWVQLYGGGPNQPCRMVVYADVRMLNQSTLLLEYVNLERYRCYA